jgi:hypothetical protein
VVREVLIGDKIGNVAIVMNFKDRVRVLFNVRSLRQKRKREYPNPVNKPSTKPEDILITTIYAKKGTEWLRLCMSRE